MRRRARGASLHSGMGSFAATHDPERVEGRTVAPLYTASKAAVTMLTTQYAKSWPDVKVNAADPGYTATDFNGHSGPQTVTEGTDAIVELATIGADGPTGRPEPSATVTASWPGDPAHRVGTPVMNPL
ncbi:SDR family NAD(P)-dependent oxidoreductase [Streptomyces massasporeus]|uniref:SDR family NAD(P)-dependent oxidoreductase n=1 Tax=Streptomyces massasporeus TaxID=67324 RepID=UPI003F53F132